MRVLTVQLGYIYGDEEKIRRECEERRKVLEGVGILIPDATKMDHGIIAVTDKQYIDLVALKEKMDVISVSNVGDTIDGVTDKIARIADRFERFAEKVGNVQYNEKCEVYTPGMGLMLFNRTMLLSDACSDALQNELDNGWRIIAACPQPDQRRPDYILGRFEPGDEPGAGRSAKRGSE
jgi:hypothetical protein